jgi:YD repeat-containing protein
MNLGAVAGAGDGGSGGDDGSAGDGGDGEGAGGGSGGDDAGGDNRNAPDPEKNPTCGTESHPVDVVTGRVFTHPIADLQLPGPLPFTFERSYSSAASKKNQGFGRGWGHSLGWFVEVERRRVRVWNEKGVSVSFPVPQVGHSVLGDWGWVLRRELWGFAVDANDEVWRVFSVTFDEGTTFRLSAIDDRNKNRIALTYDGGKLVEVEDSAGRIIKVTSTPDGHITSLQVKNAEHQGQWIRFARYEYDDRGRLVRVTDADDYAWTYAYDEHDRLVRDTDRAGLSFCFRYDAQDRGIEAWGEYIGKKDPSLADDLPTFLYDKRTRAKGIYHRKLDYHARGYTEVTDTTETRRYFGNAKGMLDKAVTGGAVTSSKYDERGFEIEKTDPMGATTRWVRDERGRVLEVVDPLGRRTTIERDANGLPVQVVDAAGGVTRALRDQQGNVESVQDAAGGTITFSHDERGLLASATDASGATARYAYDARGNLTGFVQPNGAAWIAAYDGCGRRVAVKDPTGAETRYAYSDRGDIVAVYDAAGGITRYTYDGERRVTQEVSPKGHSTSFVWGGFHKLCARRDANGSVVRLAYSREGELLAVHNEREEVHRFEYDTAGRLVHEQTFDGRTLRYRSDGAGRPVRIEGGAGESTTLVYNRGGHLVAREFSDDTTETFEYNARGELVLATNAAGEFRFERDPVGRVVRETQKVDGEEHWVEVVYDPVGNPVTRRTSLGHEERVQRDIMGARVVTHLGEDTRIDHLNDLLAREVARKLPGGGVLESAFDPMGRLAQRVLRTSDAQRLPRAEDPVWVGRRDEGITAMTSYQYDADGEVSAKHDRARGLTRYEYDPIGQLLAAVPERARAEVFRYDPAGNIHESASLGSDRVYGAGGRLLRKGQTDYEWDSHGRLLQKREHTPEGVRLWSYEWNGAGLLSTVLTPDGRAIDFTCDPFARRVGRSVRARDGLKWVTLEHTRFVWDGDALAHELRSVAAASGDPVVEETVYQFDDNRFVPLSYRSKRNDRDPSDWVHFINDPNGTPEATADGRGQQSGRAARLPGASQAARPRPRRFDSRDNNGTRRALSPTTGSATTTLTPSDTFRPIPSDFAGSSTRLHIPGTLSAATLLV